MDDWTPTGPDDCPEREFHGHPFRYCGVKGCGWREPTEPQSAGGSELELCARAAFAAFQHDVQTHARWEEAPEDMRQTFRMVADAVLIVDSGRTRTEQVNPDD